MVGQVHVVHHPLAQRALCTLRDRTLSPSLFRSTLHYLSLFLVSEATRCLAHEAIPFDAATGAMPTVTIRDRICVVPILRAGSGMLDAALAILPEDTVVHHLGMYRDAQSLSTVEYYNRLPKTRNVDSVLILDPLIATGGTSSAAIHALEEWGVPAARITLVSVLATKQGLNYVRNQYPDITVVLAGSEDVLDEKGIAHPGLGDVGDRLYGTNL